MPTVKTVDCLLSVFHFRVACATSPSALTNLAPLHHARVFMASVMSDSSLDEFRTPVDRVGDEIRSSSSAVSWGAIFAGAASAAVLSLLLVLLGTGLGLS